MSDEPAAPAGSTSAGHERSGQDPDFAYSRGLLIALRLLAARFAEEREPLPPGHAGLETLPTALPEDGIGPEAALTELAPPFLDRAAWLRHPGYVGLMLIFGVSDTVVLETQVMAT